LQQESQDEPSANFRDRDERASRSSETPAVRTSNVGAWLIVGCLGTVLVVALCVVIGGIYYLVVNIEDAPDPIPQIAEEAPVESQSDSDPQPPPDGTGDGTFTVGEEILPGRHFANNAGEFCYWARLSGFSEDPDEIIASRIVDDRAIVDIAETDVGFRTEMCGAWSEETPRRDDTSESFDRGVYLVGEEIRPGTWESQDAGETCYWARLSGFSGEIEDINANRFGSTENRVVIEESDVGFESAYCGTWVYVD
jgi:hypothetical protein